MPRSAASLRTFLAAAAFVGAAAIAAQAQAGTCPVDQMRTGARASGETMPKDVTDNEIGIVPLATEIKGLDNRRLRLRRLVVQPGGVVPWHSHTDRPAIIITLSGEMTEYRSDCAVGVVHPAGDVSEEKMGVAHWWKNTGKTEAVLLSADIKNDGDPPGADHM
jgi:quercetin dioxygenase-like cupin family protein